VTAGTLHLLTQVAEASGNGAVAIPTRDAGHCARGLINTTHVNLGHKGNLWRVVRVRFITVNLERKDTITKASVLRTNDAGVPA